MRIVIVTAVNPHTLYLCHELSRKYEVAGIFYFKRLADFRRGRLERLRLLTKSLRKDGVLRTLSAKAASWLSDHSALSLGYKEADDHFRLLLEGRFDPAAGHFCEDINSSGTAARIRALKPDVVVCHGGPKYRSGILSSAPVVINYHSGVSPAYNGAHTHAQALANRDYEYCGGTLMLLNEAIDGGPVLGHFLPALGPKDSASDLFIKLMYGSFEIVDAFLTDYARSGTYVSHPQPPDRRFFFMKDWTLGRCFRLWCAQRWPGEAVSTRASNEIIKRWTAPADRETA